MNFLMPASIDAAIYMDGNATEVPRAEAVSAMLPYLSEEFGNPAATVHERGRRSLRALEQARYTVSLAVGADVDGVIFMSGATEANNMVVASYALPGRNVVTTSFEHKCLLEAAKRGQRAGCEVRFVAPNIEGVVEPASVSQAIDRDTGLVSVMVANNEIGTLQPVSEIGAVCKAHNVRFHCDAAQALGKVPLDINEIGADYLSVSSHKLGGPPGVGALVCSAVGLEGLSPLLVGGGQEQNLRAGTTPVALCVGFAAAAEVAVSALPLERQRICALRNKLLEGLFKLGEFRLNGSLTARLPNNINGGFVGVNAARLLASIPLLHCSLGSACTTGAGQSHVLQALGLSREEIARSFRLGLSWITDESDVERALSLIRLALEQEQSMRSGS